MTRNSLASSTSRQIEEFLVGLANLRTDQAEFVAFKSKFARFIPIPNAEFRKWQQAFYGARYESGDRILPWIPYGMERTTGLTDDEQMDFYIDRVLLVVIRQIWRKESPETLHRQISGFLRVVLVISEGLGFEVSDSPPFVIPALPTPFEEAMEYLQESVSRLRSCPGPDCAAPHFFAKRGMQKYCSHRCASNAERERKLDWWRTHGSAWRKKTMGRGHRKSKDARRTRSGH
jgi:hypothetical protein